MSYEITWKESKKAIETRFYGDVSLEDIQQMTVVVNQLIQETGYELDHIIDMRGVTRFPTSLMQLSRAIGPVNPRYTGWTIVVCDDQIVRFLIATLAKLLKMRFRLYYDMEYARDFLADVHSGIYQQTGRNIGNRYSLMVL